MRSVLAPEQAEEREALMSVERVGREALAEMRRLVGILRDSLATPDLTPQPSLRGIDELISHARASGLGVDLLIEGDPAKLPASIDLTAYRIVQEGLTNAIRHAHARHARVQIRYCAGSLAIEVARRGGCQRRRFRSAGGSWPARHAGTGSRLRWTARRRSVGRGWLPAAGPAAGSDMTIRVFVVDDQALVRAGFSMIIKAEPDLEVVGEAGDGREAVDLAGRLAPHIVLMDVRMPVMDGIEATRQLLRRGGGVKVVMMTTFDMDESSTRP